MIIRVYLPCGVLSLQGAGSGPTDNLTISRLPTPGWPVRSAYPKAPAPNGCHGLQDPVERACHAAQPTGLTDCAAATSRNDRRCTGEGIRLIPNAESVTC